MPNDPSPVQQLDADACRGLVGVLCDIDDTLTHEGRLVPEAFLALERARRSGLRIVPVTGRPGGWVDHIARMWPVDGVVGENGGLWFWMGDGRLERRFLQSESERRANRERLTDLGTDIVHRVKGCALASDQPYRDLDLAIDFCEDVPPLGDDAIDAIVGHFRAAGCQCKVSSIHVNGWYGDFDKLTGCRRLVADRWGEDLDAHRERWVYFGDSANDEPMFDHFPHGVGVANVRRFLPRMAAWPRWITTAEGGMGFAEAMAHILTQRGGDL